ncbi:MAG: class I SAM-dependent methyltransferase [Gammaproteobacteria bacterium SHHR-1]
MPTPIQPSNTAPSLYPRDPAAYRQATELELMAELLPLAGARVLELGCGRAWMTRRLAEDFAVAEVIATEVDRIQHDRNLAIDDLPQVRFIYAGMESVPLEDGSVDIAIMLKSLHHVPAEQMAPGFAELYRVLRPGGLVYVSEPVYAGEFNAIMSLFNDEQQVRQQAFEALCQAVRQGLFVHQGQYFFESTGHFADWQAFEQRMLNVTHTQHRIDAALYQRIKAAFEAHLTPTGADFLKPSRVDLLQKA